MVGGCDPSLLISSNAFASAERGIDINLSLPGVAFDVVVRAKTALELQCPALSIYNIRLGRKDSFESYSKDVEGHIARPNMTMDTIINMFATKNLNVQVMVALVDAHTIGFSHCSEFSKRIFKFSQTSEFHYGNLCANNSKDMAAINDVMTPGKFDNMYYMNLLKGLGLLASNQAMISYRRTKPFAFAYAMEKVSIYQVKIGKMGEVRRRCGVVNTPQVNPNKKIAG
ncbi:unnamed protein product [Withania somnifera]